MPPQYIFDISQIDFGQVLFDQQAVRDLNPQRGAMEHLNGIVWADPANERLIGFKDVSEDEFWVPGHIPGRPLLPGVIMLEAAAQLASFYTKKYVGWTGFIGFGGVGDTKFRQAVAPGARLNLLCQQTWNRHRRIGCKIQGLLANNSLVFETEIIGTQM